MPGAEAVGWMKYDRDWPGVEYLLALLWHTVYASLSGKEPPVLEGKWLGRTAPDTNKAIHQMTQAAVLEVVKKNA